MITVMGASGRVGRQVAAALDGEEVRVVGRSAERLAVLPGAVPFVGDAGDPAFLTEAFRGAAAVFTMLPVDSGEPDHRAAQEAKATAIATAVRDAGVPYVVALSSLGAELPTGTGFIEGLHVHEQRLAATGAQVLALRPGWFLENAADAVGPVEVLGCVADSLDPDLPLPMVATRDVAAAAARALRTRYRSGVVELLGPRDLTQTEVAAVLGKALDRPDLPYVRLPDDEMVAALVGAGFSPAAAARHIGMTGALNSGRISAVRTAENTTPTGIEDLVGEWVA
ncbi:NAD(P)H-binding protein [Pseudonocardia abyssalis]|uniref:NAD(P)H-binding protein n=1 Tax=Pseudonocardia abyssalis TaxID=2792008 RepID=A0ABS6UPR7_9PSEU|nr:NAD(P)H-binding protein [Pseudonocardia abyssalis]MBW0117288.1 NAD(P)H-binding protein [Pseudonocardia abyssalis]MBW0134225.1 NAD(P)H-binding protein [Pseudonocardia abyssalis]